MTMTPAEPFNPERDLTAPSLYSLNLSAAQHCTLAWVEDHGGLFNAVPVPVETVAQDCGNSLSTVHDALARLKRLRLLVRTDAGLYRINARYYFTLHPELRDMIATALTDPPVTPDDRAHAPRKVGNTDSRRRRTIRPVS
ncbi:MarR family transcriptional regulator [Streptomyces sp. AC627_RSS907]|uniref:MarR family transcriptional regulator n=1 Tax=Streptomyces sp. AC627_RSS907 TaxID=2823684 RepID=UPI0020B76F30|nr:MarR family transcriptional regulator [Streptomyces sp. AC627_RSS907]